MDSTHWQHRSTAREREATIAAQSASSTGAITVESSEVLEVVTRALTVRGAAEAEARVQAWHLIEGDLRGHASHGIRRLATLTGRIDAGLVNVASRPRYDWHRPGALGVDGDGGFGPVIAHRAVDLLLERASETGIASAAMHGTHHLGMLAPYAEAIVARGAVGILFTTTEALVHAWGGRGALVGTNPICVGVPAVTGPLVVDMSTAAASAGAIIDRAERGIPLPEGWAVDADGSPTTDAAAARTGAIAPFGGPKGYALGVAFEALVGLLTGTAFGTAVAGTLDQDRAVTKGDLFIVLPIAAFGGTLTGTALDSYLETVRASGANDHAVAVPGDRARDQRARSLRDGVALDPAVWQTALELAGEK